MILSADVDEGEASSGIDAMAWDVLAQRAVRNTFRGHVFSGPGPCETRTTVIELDPARRYLYGPHVDAYVRPLFDAEPTTDDAGADR